MKKGKKSLSYANDKATATRRLVKEFKGRVAVYIDAANLEKSVKSLGLTPPRRFKKGMRWKADSTLWSVNYIKLYQFFMRNSKLVSISFYTARFGTKNHDNFLTFLKNKGYRLVTKSVKTIPGRGRIITCEQCGYKNIIPDERKADFDVEISVDATSWMDNYETFILFSGDSDFVFLINFLKKRGKRIVIFSRRGHVANELRTSKDVDYYEDIWKMKEEFLIKRSLKAKSRQSRD